MNTSSSSSLKPNDRTSRLMRPYPTSNASLNHRYRQLGRKATRPYSWFTGCSLFSWGIGILIFALLGDLYNSLPLLPLATITGAAILGLITGILAHHVARTYYVMPRGLCFLKTTTNSTDIKRTIPLVCYLLFLVLSIIFWKPVNITLVIASIYASLLALLFRKYGEADFLICSIALFVAPTILVFMGFITPNAFDTMLDNTLVAESIILTVYGIQRSRHTYVRSEDEVDLDLVKQMLISKKPAQRLLASVFCTGYIEPRLMGLLLDCTKDDNDVVAYESQIAFSNMWGPEASDLLSSALEDEQAVKMLENLPEHIKVILKEEQAETFDQTRVHQEEVENEARKLPTACKESYERLISLAQGQRVLVKQAQLVAIEILGCVHTPRAYAALMEGLLSEAPEIIHSAETAFYGADPSAMVYLEKFFTNRQAAIRIRAIRATLQLLAFWNRQDSDTADTIHALLEPSLPTLLSDPDNRARALALSLLPIKRPRTLTYLRELGESEPENSLVGAEARRLLNRTTHV